MVFLRGEKRIELDDELLIETDGKWFHLVSGEVDFEKEYKQKVVDYMLDAVETDLGRRLSFRDRILEPSAGDGAFVKPLVERILRTMPRGDWSNDRLLRALLAFETNPAHAATFF